MQHLAMPETAAKEDQVIARACVKYDWAVHAAVWLAAYDTYRTNKGDPWSVSPATFVPDITSDLYDLYDARKSGGPLKRMREKKGLLSCPVCGSGTKGSLDHYLPRSKFGEFAIMRANLVPACSICNSSGKGTTYKGKKAGERLIHPYFDDWANCDLWMAVVNKPFKAATFTATPIHSLDPVKWTIVAFHLKTVLTSQFHDWVETRWSRLPELMREMDTPSTIAGVESFIANERKRAAITDGANSWNAALMRGIEFTAGASTYLASLI